MAPPPDYEKEPKAPDKCAIISDSDEANSLTCEVNDELPNMDNKSAGSVTNSKSEEDLRALLEEVYGYKAPKDREGMSDKGKKLLDEAVKEDKEASTRSLGSSSRRRAVGRNRRALPHSNSMQDLVEALEDKARHSRHHGSSHHNVSARAIHGGSLPSGVDTSSLLCEEVVTAAKQYSATVTCRNPSPLQRRVSTSDAHAQLASTNDRVRKSTPMTYTARATLEIGSGGPGRAVTTTTPSSQVDSAIPFSCITTPEVVTSSSSTTTSQATVAVDPKPLHLGSWYRAVASLTGADPPSATSDPPESSPLAGASTPPRSGREHYYTVTWPRSVIASTFNGLPLSRPNYGSTGSSATEDFKKSLDENGNSVQGFSSPQSGSSQHKKPRRKKSSKNETVIKSDEINGYQGDKDINEVLKFIESNAESEGRSQKLGRAKHKDDSDDKGGKKRSTDRRKDKENKMKRAISMEEISRTTIEDLTANKASSSSPLAQDKRWTGAPERRSWGDDTRPDFYFEAETEPTPELTDFQTVTKRRKPKKRADEPAAGDAPPRKPRPPSPAPRAVSDRSNDSNDDMDSVHSLPAPPPTQPVSYADIARTRHNIPDLIESCNYYAEGEPEPRCDPIPPAPPDDGFPSLEPPVGRRSRDMKPQARKERKAVCPDVVAEGRPPVILLDAGAPGDMAGVTFGFDVNEQLVSGRQRRCDLVRDALAGVLVPLARPLRWLPPPPPAAHSHQLQQIIDYVANAWDDVVRCGTGKVRYFNE